MTSRNTERIRELNDAFRASGTSALGQWVMTPGVSGQGTEFMLLAIANVMSFDTFTRDNDPHGEHDFGSFKMGDQSLFWKIDYYDPSLTFGSDDPSDIAKTRRVLTIMLASEY